MVSKAVSLTDRNPPVSECTPELQLSDIASEVLIGRARFLKLDLHHDHNNLIHKMIRFPKLDSAKCFI